jgi:magnesium chelatase subunit D
MAFDLLTRTIDRNTVYPFSAVVGQPGMKRALILAAIHPGLGGVLIRGSKGAAKSTAVRALAMILPEIDVYPGDPFRRAPGEDVAGWPLSEDLSPVKSPVTLINLPVGATEDRVVGSLNLERALSTGARAFEPGLLASANRGILYIDEVNLLGDHLVDLLLDAAAMGVNHVEREGLTFRHPSRFVLVGTMNPEEGDLRPQLLDRFGLAVDVDPMHDPAQRAEVVRRRLAFEADPAAFRRAWDESDRLEGARIAEAQRLLPSVVVPAPVLDAICTRCAAEGAEGLRADITIFKAASALAAHDGRITVTFDDMDAAAELALAHRRTTPRTNPPNPPPPRPQNGDRESPDPPRTVPDGPYYAERNNRESLNASADDASTSPVGPGDDEVETIRPAEPQAAFRWNPPSDGMRRPGSSKGRSCTRAPAGRFGAFVGTTVPKTRSIDPAIDATLVAAAPWQVSRGRCAGGSLILRPADLRDKVRKTPARHLVLFVVDSSRSMGARKRMAETKATILSLLVDAYQKRDLVGMVTFGGTDARIALPPTRSVRAAARFLAELPVGGLTPLATGLQVAERLIATFQKREPGLTPLVVLLTDGRGNVPIHPHGDPFQDALRLVRQLASSRVHGLVIDTETGPVRLGRARAMAEAWGAEVRSLDELGGQRLPEAIRRTLLAG